MNTFPKLRAPLAWLAAAWPVMVTAQATAPAASRDGDATLPPVQVVGQREPATASGLVLGSGRSSLQTPFSVGRTSSDQLREQGATTLQDALRGVPGAQADTGFNGSHTQFFILRGAVTDSGTGSNRVLRDGVRLSNYPYVPAFIDSVDVLRGPGAVVGVRSEPGGTVNLVTRRPQFADFGSVRATAGSERQGELSVDMNRVLSGDRQWAARVTATRSQASEWRHVPDRLDGVKLGVTHGDGSRHQIRAGFEATDQTYRPDYGHPSLDGRPVAVPRDRQLGEPFGDSTTRNRIADLHGEVALDAATRATLGFTRLEADSTSIKNLLNGSPLANQPVGTWARVSAWEPGTTRRIDSIAASLQRQQTIAGTLHRLYVGLDHYTERLDQPSLSVSAATSPPINVYAPVYGLVTPPPAGATLNRTLTTQDLKAVGATLQDQVDIGAWSVVAGLRFDRQHFMYGTAGVQAVEESRWSPKFALLRRLDDGGTVYANFAAGTSPNQVASSSNRSLPSRRSVQAELGWKAAWNGGRLRSDLAAYRLDQSNMISSDLSTPANNFDFTVAGEARSQGVEASLGGTLADGLELTASYAYTAARYRYNATYGGRQVPNVARHVLGLWVSRAWTPAWKTSLGVSAQSRRFADEANTTVLPGYAKVDLTQSWTTRWAGGQSLEVQLAVRNLFDREYHVSSHLHVSRWITPAPGRHASLSATYSF